MVALGLGGSARASHTPSPSLGRGGWGGGFSKSMTGFSGLSPEGDIRING
ncbi:hypothetical protein [Coprobacter secundus]|nr:hypothetical protein [Coprobacter secundus]